jgi:anti-sigma factor (TIGR02949 family)
MNCPEAIEHLYSYLDRECTAETEAAVRVHIEQCSDCFGQFEFERAFLLFVKARSAARTAPTELKKRIFQEILLGRDRET